MQTRSRNRALLLGLLALLLLLLVGGGVFLLLNGRSKPASSPGTSTPDITRAITPTANIDQAITPTPAVARAGPVKAEAGDTIVTLTWEPVRDATGYFVHRDGGRDPLNFKALTETRYMDIGLTNGRVYTYTVAPVIGGVEGSNLPPVQAAPSSPR